MRSFDVKKMLGRPSAVDGALRPDEIVLVRTSFKPTTFKRAETVLTSQRLLTARYEPPARAETVRDALTRVGAYSLPSKDISRFQLVMHEGRCLLTVHVDDSRYEFETEKLDELDRHFISLLEQRVYAAPHSDPLARVPLCVYLGGSAERAASASHVSVVFAKARTYFVTFETGDVIQADTASLVGIEIWGPGRVEEGGGFIGGGFGLEGAVKGMAAAEVLNRLTTRSTINTFLKLQWSDQTEDFLFYDGEPPQDLRVRLSHVFSLLNKEEPGAPANSLVRDLDAAAALLEKGLLTEQEFTQLKGRLFS